MNITDAFNWSSITKHPERRHPRFSMQRRTVRSRRAWFIRVIGQLEDTSRFSAVRQWLKKKKLRLWCIFGYQYNINCQLSRVFVFVWRITSSQRRLLSFAAHPQIVMCFQIWYIDNDDSSPITMRFRIPWNCITHCVAWCVEEAIRLRCWTDITSYISYCLKTVFE